MSEPFSNDNDDDRTVIRPATPGAQPADAGPVPVDAKAPAAAAAPVAAEPATPPAAGQAMPTRTDVSPEGAGSASPDRGNALPAGTRLGEFELLSVLGEGGFGIVYVAQDHSLQRRVALKEYMPSALAQRDGRSQVQVRSERHRETFEVGLKSFVNEARLLAQFDHPSLVKVYRFWEANGTAYMVMPLYEGVTLKDKLQAAAAPPDEAWLMGMLAPLTEALAVIHAENCFHRDIAPDNVILLAGSERPLLLDFGAARRVISDMTQALTVILKPGYAPVEQYAEVPEMKQGPWTDVYALAATVHWAILGRTPPTAVGRLMNDAYKPLAEAAAGRYSPGFLQALDQALKVKPAERTQDIAAFRQALGLQPTDTMPGASRVTVLQEPRSAPAGAVAVSAPLGTATASTPRGAATTASAAGPRRLLLGGLALGALAVGGGAWFVLRRPDTAAPAATATAAAPTGSTPPTPAPAAPVAPPPTSAAREFEIQEEFRKVLAGASPEFQVKAQALQPVLRIGRDKLAFTVTSNRQGFVHVMVLGPNGSLTLLFPNALASDNRIRAGQTLKLPQDNWLLETVEPTGSEDFLVIVSDQPRDYSELSREREYIFLKLPTGRQGAQAALNWTRSTPMLLGGLKNCPSADCEAYGAARFSVTIEN